jgi:hypothetical protein
MLKSNFLSMNLRIMSHLGKRDLDCRTQSNTIVSAMVGTPSKIRFKVDPKDEKKMVKWRGFEEDAEWGCKK